MVYAAVTMVEFAAKQMMEHLLDRMAVPAGDNNVGLEGYLDRTNEKFRVEVVAKITECKAIKDMNTEEASTEDVKERKRANDEWLTKYPHSVQAHDHLLDFMQATFQGPPFALPTTPTTPNLGTGATDQGTDQGTIMDQNDQPKSDGVGTTALAAGELEN